MSSFASSRLICKQVAELVRPPRRVRPSLAAAERMMVVDGGGKSAPFKPELTPYMIEPMDCLAKREYDAVVFVGPARTGKALDVDTPIPTPDGWTSMGDLQEGDTVFDEQGQPARVVFSTEYQLNRKCFEVEFSDGEKIVADADHQWGVERFYWKKPKWRYEVVTTADFMRDLILQEHSNGRKRYRYRIRNTAPIKCDEKTLPIDPYLLGLWLGDGSSGGGQISAHKDDAPYYEDRFKAAGHVTETALDKGNTVIIYPDKRYRLTTHCQRGHEFALVGRAKNGGCKECMRLGHWRRKYGHDRNGDKIPEPSMFSDTFISRLRALNVLGNKHIPAEYLRASHEQRLDLLRGLMDTDGCCDSRSASAEFTTILPALKDGFVELAASLGLKPRVADKATSWTYNGEYKTSSAYRVTFPVPEGINPFALPRKAENVRHAKIDVGYRQIVSIRQVKTRPVKCIQVDSPSSLYLAGRTMIPTHNTNALIDGWVAYVVSCDPGDMLIVQISEEKAREYSKKRIDRMLRNSPRLAELMSPHGHDNNVHDKTFRAGNYLGIKWPTVNVLSSSDYRFVALTDYDRLGEDLNNEGDPFSLANKRTQTFMSSGMTLVETSPGWEITDPDWKPDPSQPHQAPPTKGALSLYNLGTRHRWYWPCPECDEWFQPNMEHFNLEAACPVCPHCGSLIEGAAQKRHLNAKGKWIAEEGRKSRIASFWMEGPAATFQSWDSLAEKLRQAEEVYEQTGSQEKLKTVINTDWGRPYLYRRAESARSLEAIQERAERLGQRVVPEGVRCLFGSVDVQGGKKRRFVVQVIGYGVDGERWLIDRFSLRNSDRMGDDGQPLRIDPAGYPEDWDLLTTHIVTRKYPLADGSGREMPVLMTAIDTGGEGRRAADGATNSVSDSAYKYYRRIRQQGLHRKVMLVKGLAKAGGTSKIRESWPDSTGRKDRHASSKGDIPLYLLDTNLMKDIISNNLEREQSGPGYIHFPDWLGEWFFEELTYEQRDEKGRWFKPGKANNEAFDLFVYADAAAFKKGYEKIKWASPPPWAREWDENTEIQQDGRAAAATTQPSPKERPRHRTRFRF